MGFDQDNIILAENNKRCAQGVNKVRRHCLNIQ